MAVAMAATANAQEAFKNVGVGVEVGLMGVGVQVSVPVITDKLIINAGYNIPLSGSISKDVDNDYINDVIDDVNKRIANDKKDHPDHEYRALNKMQGDMGLDADLNVGGNFKILAEFYPSTKSTFHVTAGVMIGSSDFLKLNVKADDKCQQLYQDALYNVGQLRKYGEVGPNEDIVGDNLTYILDNTRYYIDEKEAKELAADGKIKIQSVKPYIGFGFGRAIPRKRVGVQFELGAWFHGKPTYDISGSGIKKEAYDPVKHVSFDRECIQKDLDKICIYPQMTLRLTGRIL